MKALLIALVAVLLCSCSTTPATRIDRIEVPVEKPCIKAVPKRPVYRFGKGAKPASDVELANLLAQDFEAAEQYGHAWEAAASGCVINDE